MLNVALAIMKAKISLSCVLEFFPILRVKGLHPNSKFHSENLSVMGRISVNPSFKLVFASYSAIDHITDYLKP